MEKFATEDRSRWDTNWESFQHFKDEDKKPQYDALMNAFACISRHMRRASEADEQRKADRQTDVAKSYALLGITCSTGPQELAKVLMTRILIIPRCDLSIQLWPGGMLCAACAPLKPTDKEMEHWEHIHVFSVAINQSPLDCYPAELTSFLVSESIGGNVTKNFPIILNLLIHWKNFLRRKIHDKPSNQNLSRFWVSEAMGGNF